MTCNRIVYSALAAVVAVGLGDEVGVGFGLAIAVAVGLGDEVAVGFGLAMVVPAGLVVGVEAGFGLAGVGVGVGVLQLDMTNTMMHMIDTIMEINNLLFMLVLLNLPFYCF